MLHVTNGSIAVSRLHDLGLPGQFVPWDDPLHEGPVPSGVSEAELRHIRAEFLSTEVPEIADIERALAGRDQRLADATAGDEIVLWFEHDLYDQLQVLQILDHLRQAGSSRTARVTAVLADDYLTGQSDEQLSRWFDERRLLTDAQWDAAAAAWQAFRAADPSGLHAFDHSGAWPSLRASLRRHLQQYPAVGTGLSRTETYTLNALADGPLSLRAAFKKANAEVEPAMFMGDLGWWHHIRPLLTGVQPLISVIGERPATFHDGEWWRDDESAPTLALTETGAHVLAGESDHLALNGINRWLGGVHLMALPGHGDASDQRLWRWDDARGLVRA